MIKLEVQGCFELRLLFAGQEGEVKVRELGDEGDWIILGHFGAFWTILDVVELFGRFWTISDHFRPLWSPKIWTISDHFDHF